jgi:hypothetical protein
MGTLSAQGGESCNQSTDHPYRPGNLGLNVARNGSFSYEIPLFGRMLSALFNEIGRR